MKTKIYLTMAIALCIAKTNVQSQNIFLSRSKTGVHTTTSDARSLQDIPIPRITQSQRNALKSPATGTMVYVTDVNPGYYFYSGLEWIKFLINSKFWLTNGNSSMDSAINFIGTTDKNPFIIRTNNKERVHVSSNGNVGIGISAPAALLHVRGNIENGPYATLTENGLFVLGDTSAYNLAMDNVKIQARLSNIASDLYLNTYGGGVYVGNSSNSYYGVNASASDYGIEGYGASGTGVTGTGSSYGVSGFSYSGTGVYGYTSGGYGGGYFYNTGGNGVVGYDGGTFGVGVAGYEAGNGQAVSGTVYGSGIGVLGTAYNGIGVFGQTFNDSLFAGYFNGSVYTTGTYISSDEKLKQNITDLSSAMNIISQLKPKNYNFRHDGDYKLINLPAGQHYGLIAQDVEKVLPNLVKETSLDESVLKHKAEKAIDSAHNAKSVKPAVAQQGKMIKFKAVNYTELIPIIIKGMQEQQQTITDLKQVVQQQQQQINQLLAVNAVALKADALKTVAGNSSLLQNTPNPFSSGTTIRCTVPKGVANAQIVIFSADGKALKTYSVSNTGTSTVSFDASTFATGNYRYNLIADGKIISSKSMVIAR